MDFYVQNCVINGVENGDPKFIYVYLRILVSRISFDLEDYY